MEIASYKISIELDFAGLAYAASEEIEVAGSEGTLSLDSVDLDIQSVKTKNGEIEFRLEKERLVIPSLPKGDLTLSINFSAKVNEKRLHGFYASKFGKEYVLTTDFEPKDARSFFPCVDDPKFKARFTLSVVADKGLSVISNMPISRTTELSDGKKRTDFETTPKMSTYLFYLGVGRFDQASSSYGGKLVTAATTPGQIKKTEIPLENAIKYLERLENYYGTEYPLDKLHLIGLPEYTAGAMENWGAITFREVALFVDDSSSVANKRRAAKVLGHEIAHQWFGDLVTMKWWDDLWLNESFATFMETKITDQLFPDWRIWDSFLEQDYGGAMQADSLENTHPVVVPVEEPEMIEQIFDHISYGKGASVLRMIEAYIGKENFRNGVVDYLSRFKYANAQGADLWNCLAESSNIPVGKIMQSWLTQAGFPLVEVSHSEGLSIAQKRFSLKNHDKAASMANEDWPIPLTILINNQTKKFLLQSSNYQLPLPQRDFRIVKVNAGQTGFYRVLYDRPLYDLLETEFSTLDPPDQWGIIQDLFAFVISQKVDLELYLSFARKCFEEDRFLLANAVAEQLETLLFLGTRNYRIREAFQTHFRFQIQRLGLSERPGEKEEDKILRGVISSGLAMNDDETATTLSRRFDQFFTDDPNLRSAIAIGYARTFGAEAFDGLVQAATTSRSEADLIKLYSGLTAFKDPRLVQRGLDFSISGNVSRTDCVYAITAASYNHDASEAVWTWTRKNLPKVIEIFRGAAASVGLILDYLIPRVGLGKEEEIREYFSNPELHVVGRGASKGLELLEVYSELTKRINK